MQEIFNRRSIRQFNGNPVEKDKIDKLIRAGMQAPSGMNQQAWEFIVVTSKETLSKLAKTTLGSKPILDASVTILVVVNKEKLIVESVWKSDLAAATENILLEAVHLNLGAVWLGVGGEKEDKYLQEVLGYPANILPFALIAIGYPKNAKNEFIDRFDAKKVHHEKW